MFGLMGRAQTLVELGPRCRTVKTPLHGAGTVNIGIESTWLVDIELLTRHNG